MNKIPKVLMLLLVACTTCLSLLNAETKFTCAKFNKVDTSNLYYKDGRDYVKLAIPASVRSKIFSTDLGEEKSIIFYSLSQDAEGEEIYTPIAKSTIPENTDKVLILFAPSSEGSNQAYRLFTVDDSLDVFPVGSYRFFNFSKEPLLVNFDDKKTVIKPNSESMIQPETSNNGRFVPFILKNKDGERYYETRLIGQKLNREIVFILPHPTSNVYKVRLQFLTDTVIPVKEEEGL